MAIVVHSEDALQQVVVEVPAGMAPGQTIQARRLDFDDDTSDLTMKAKWMTQRL